MVDFKNNSDEKWKVMSPADKKQELFRRQKELLDTFLSTYFQCSSLLK